MLKKNRRDWFKSILGAAAIAPIAGLVSRSVAFAADKIYKKAELATEKKNPSVAALKYVADGDKSKARQAAKMGVEAKLQYCNKIAGNPKSVACNFYKNPGKLEGSNEAVGQCLMLQNQVVHAKGWCNVWTKKA